LYLTTDDFGATSGGFGTRQRANIKNATKSQSENLTDLNVRVAGKRIITSTSNAKTFNTRIIGALVAYFSTSEI